MAMRFLFLILVACTPISRQTGEFHPQTAGYSYEHGVVSFGGKALYQIVQTDVDRYTTAYEVKAVFDGSTQALITFASSYGGTLECRAAFPLLGVHYEARIPIVPFTTLLASYLDNGVLADGQVSVEGLHGSAARRGVALVDTAAQQQRLSRAGAEAACRECGEDYRRCQVDASYARAHPAPGVHVVESCEARYQACSQGGIMTRPDQWPCGPAPM